MNNLSIEKMTILIAGCSYVLTDLKIRKRKSMLLPDPDHGTSREIKIKILLTEELLSDITILRDRKAKELTF